MSVNFNQLSEKQFKAVKAVNGAVACTSAAGSGKTFVLTNRIVYMIQKAGINPKEILAFTFTKKTGNELQERLEKMLGGKAADLTVGTIHSVFFRILREEYPTFYPEYHKMQVVMGWKQKKLIKEAFKKAEVGDPTMYKNPNIALANIGLAKSELMSPTALERFLYENEQDRKLWIIQVYKLYERLKRKEVMLDFDDMLFWVWNLFRDYPDVKKRWQGQWNYVLVDEFQDTNTAQYEVIKMLVEPHNNLFIVGDERQSIYGFRGARADYIRNFSQEFGSAKTVELDLTYRCRQEIVNVSNKLGKIMGTEPAISHKSGGVVEYLGHYADEDEEADIVAGEIKQMIVDGREPKDFKVLYRTNAQSRALEEHMVKMEIPYLVKSGFSFFDRKEVKDMICYLRVIENPDSDEEAYERIINRPNRFLGKAFVRQWKQQNSNGSNCLDTLKTGRWNRKYMRENAHKLHNQITRIIGEISRGDMSVGEMVSLIRQGVKYDEWMIENEGEMESEEYAHLLDNLNELVEVGHRFDSIKKFLQYVSLIKDQSSKDKNANAVQLMTIHKSKGLEAPVVFVVGVSQGVLPHERSETPEERRLMYVAVTRAADEVYLSGFSERFNTHLPPSKFLEEMEIADVEERFNEMVTEEVNKVKQEVLEGVA